MQKLVNLNDFYRNLHNELTNGVSDPWEVIDHALNNTKVIDASEIIHGYWKDGYKCSNCGAYVPTDSMIGKLNEKENKYCFNCGAKMGDQDED